MTFSNTDYEMMQKALSLAEKGLYSTKPNPAVGCVLTKDNKPIAQGWHQKAGQPHAEIEALNQAKAEGLDIRGATAYVTLEPCSHTGKTPPCSNALIAAGISRVVIGMVDPNPLVAGNGIKRMQDAGIQVEVGLLEAQAESLNSGFIQTMKTQKPYVRLKMATSFDGRTAMSNGESKWITGSEARKAVHFMRARHGAIITGIGTVLADDPSLNVRLSDEELASVNLTQETCHPIRVILDPHMSMPLDAKMLSLPGRTIVMTSKETTERQADLIEAFYEKGIELVAVAAEEDALDLESVLGYLSEVEKVNDVMVESGSMVAGAFIQSGFVNEIHSYVAPILMGEHAKPMFTLPDIESMDDKLSFEFLSCEKVGDDMHVVLKPKVES